MTVINRFSTTDRAAISFTGNTLGLIGTFNPSQAVITDAADGIGTFVTTNTALTSPGGYPAGTTQTFSLNKCAAILTMLPASSVLYAELIWSGAASNALQNVSSSLGNGVQLTTPLGNTVTVLPDAATAQGVTNLVALLTVYVRTANVTSIVRGAGAGTYTIANVPGALGGVSVPNAGTLESNYLGWTLAVVYRNAALAYRNINLFVMCEGIAQNTTVDVPISGFVTPPLGPVSARLAVTAGSGDTYIGNDTMSFGRNTSALTVLSGPNNSSTNFFSSQINNGDSESTTVGQLNTTGTFGTRNQPIGGKSVAGRQGWDITNINVSSTMVNNQTSAIARFSTGADVYVPSALGIQINVGAPNITPISKKVDKSNATIGDTLTYTITFRNTGFNTANNALLIDTIPNGTSFVADSLIVNGVGSSSTPNPPGVPLGTIGVNQSVTITFKVMVVSVPAINPIPNQASVGYNFTVGTIPISGIDASSIVTTKINVGTLIATKSVDKVFGSVGDTLTYTILLTNTGNATVNNIIFLDTIPSATTFISGSLTQNGTLVGGSPAPPGITLPSSIGVGGVSTVIFKVRITDVPVSNTIVNTANMTGKFTADPSVPNGSSTTSNTNQVITTVNRASLSNPIKTVDKNFATCEDTLTYTIVIPNTGNTTALGVVLKDTIPNGTVLIADSVKVNGIVQSGANPSTGMTIGSIAAGAVATVEFKVMVQC